MFKDNLSVTIGAPAILSFVPMVLVGFPACIAAFFLVGGAAALKSTAAWIALIPVIAIACLAFAVVYNAIRVGWTKIMLSLMDGQKGDIADIIKGSPWFINFIAVTFIIGVGSAIGGFLFVIPGIFFAVRTCLAPFLIVDRNMGPIEALKASNDMVTGYSWQIFFYFVLLAAANAVCSFIPIVGPFVTVGVMGYFDLALARVYAQRRNLGQGLTSFPPLPRF